MQLAIHKALESFANLLVPKRAQSGTPELDSRSFALRATLIVIFANVAFLCFHPLFQKWPFNLALLGFAIGMIVVRGLYIRWHDVAATWTYSVLVFLAAIIASTSLGGIRSPGMQTIITVILAAWMILGVRAGLIASAIGFALLLGVAGAEALNWISPASIQFSTGFIVLRYLTNFSMIIVMLMIWHVKQERLFEQLSGEIKKSEDVAIQFHRYAMALVEVATDPIVLGPDFDKSIQQIERIAGTVLKTSRTGVWLIDREHQVGLSSTYYDFEKGTHGNGTPKPLANFSTYLESLDVERYIDANDAQVDPRLAEWREFNRDANILSVLDASIRVEGNLVGAVCFEEIASKRMWTPSEMAFASMIADQTGLLILLNQLRKSEEAIRKLNEELEVRVQDRTLELKVRNEDLEFFSYTVSHDLRSPLRSMAGFSGILRTDYRDKLDDEGRTMLQRIDIATKRMAEMLDGILEYSRVGLSTSHYNLVNLNSIIERTVREVQQQMGAHKVAVEFDIESVEVSADTEGIAICIRNIVGNAFKFSSKSDHPKVSVTARLVNGNCEISIEDNGAGFDQQYSKKIFEMFNRLNPDIEIGSGIGLTIVSRVIQRMNGTIEVESEPGRGSKFTLTIPVDVTADRAAG